MATLPVEVLFGIYLGFLTGIVPALVAFSLGFLFKYLTDITIPAFGVVVLGVAVAGINGGLLALADPTITQSTRAPTILSALLVVLMLTFYAHDKGDKLGARLPRRLTLAVLRERTLSIDVVNLVGQYGRVQIQVTGEVRDIEGYPQLPDDIRAEIRDREWTLPADRSIDRLETAFADRLRNEFDLAAVQVQLDSEARATVWAAPSLSGLSKRVPAGERAVSVDALVPTGLARGDLVTVRTGEGEVDGMVISARSTGSPQVDTPVKPTETPPTTEPTVGSDHATTARAPRASGGAGRVTVAVDPREAEALLGAENPAIVVRARGLHREYELVSLLRRAGHRLRKIPVGTGGTLDELPLNEANLRQEYGVAVLAVRQPSGWNLSPRGTTVATPGDEIFAVGTREALDRFAEAVA